MLQVKVQTIKVGVYLLLSALLFQIAAPVVAQTSEPDALAIQREYKNPLQVSVTAVDKLLSVEDQFEFTVSVTNDAAYPMTNVWVQLPVYTAIEYLALDAEVLRVERLAPNETLQIPVSAKLLEAKGEMELKVRVTAVEAKATSTILSLNTKGEASDISLESLPPDPPEPWQYTFTAPGSSGFTGSAQYSYGFDVPPGDGGLTPALSISYGSRGLDTLRPPVMSRGFGSGWSMPQAEIINQNALDMGATNPSDFYNHKFTLVLNGASYPLIYKDYATGNQFTRYGEYLAIGDPTLYIEYIEEDPQNPIPNDSGEYWEVRTSNGTVYRFGYTEDAEQMVEVGDGAAANPNRNEPQPRNEEAAPTSWKLDLITDVDEHKVQYVYQTACFVAASGSGCHTISGTSGVESEADVAIQKINYNFSGTAPQTKIEFTYQTRNGWALHQRDLYKTVGYYKPAEIYIKQRTSPSVFQLISRYHIQYGETSHEISTDETDSWWITKITRYGSDSVTALPPTEFVYEDVNSFTCDDGINDCVPYLWVVKNGYGAVSKITYEQFGTTDYYRVSDIHTWDGVNNIYLDPNVGTATSHTEYDYSGATACYNSAGDPCGDTTPDPSDPETYPHNFTDSLVGFSEVKTYAKDPVSPYSTLSSSEQTFVINDYWGKGRTIASTSYLPNTTTPIQETVNTWVLGTEAVRLGSTETFVYDNTTSNAKVGTKQTYHYDPTKQGGQQLGLTTQVDTQIWDNTLTIPGWSAVQTRSTTLYIVEPPDDGDDFYQIVPWTQGLYEGDWTPLQVSLLLYDGNLYSPDTQTVTDGKLTLQRTLLLDTQRTGSNKVLYDTIDTTFTYDSFGNQEYIRAYEGPGVAGYNTITGAWTESSVFPGNGSVHRETQIGYSADGRTIEWTENPANHRSQYSYDPLFTWLPATMGTEIDTGTYASSTYKYDTFGRLIEIYDDQESTTEPLTVYTYNDTNGAVGGSTPFSMKTETRPDVYHNNAGGAGYELASISYLDGLGRTLQTVQLDGFRDSNNNDQHVRTSVAYDALGRTICTTSPEKVTTTAYDSAFDCLSQSEITTQTYDDAGRVASITDVDGSVTRQYYGNTGGNETYVTTIDANHHRTQAHTDMFGNLVASIEFTGDCRDSNIWNVAYSCDAGETAWAPYTTAEFIYDLTGNLTDVNRREDNVDGTVLATTTMTYDDLGRKIDMTDPDMGYWQYQYDLFGNLEWQKDAKNQEICFVYDGLNRLTEKGVPAVAGDCSSSLTSLATYEYDGADNGLGQLNKVSWGDDQANNYDTFVYDGRGRVVENTRVIHGREYTQKTISFDLLGRPLDVQYPDGEIVTLTYDGQGENTLQAGTNLLVDNLIYNERGQLRGLHRYQQFNTIFYYYDTSGNSGHPHRLEMIANGTNSDAIPDFKYSYDNVGNITQMREFHTSSSAPVDDQRFTYDALNRLTDASTTVAYGNGGYDHEYFYDELGNIDSWNKDGQVLDYKYGINRPHSVINININEQLFTYDANGNMETRNDEHGNFYQTFDVENRLTRVYEMNAGTRKNIFEYDHSGQRVVADHMDSLTFYPFPNFQETVSFETTYATDFEDITSWTSDSSPDFPATSIWHDNWGITSSYSGTQSVSVSNLMNGRMVTKKINVTPNVLYTASFYARGVLNAELSSEGSWFARVYYKDSSDNLISTETSTKYHNVNSTWTQYTYSFTPPANTATVQFALITELQSGWLAFDNLDVSTSLASIYQTGFEDGEDDEWVAYGESDFPATAVWHHNWGIAAPYAGTQAVSISNLMTGAILTEPFYDVDAGKSGTVEVYARGGLDTVVSEAGHWFIRVHFRDSNGTYLGNQTSTKRDVINADWTKYTFTFTPPANTDYIQVALASELQSGWLAFDDLVINGSKIRETGFEASETGEWSPYNVFPEFSGTSTWNGTWGIAAPRTGSQAVAISNLMHGDARTIDFDVQANETYRVNWYARGQFDNLVTPSGRWYGRVSYYDTNHTLLSWEDFYNNDNVMPDWTHYYEDFTTPAGTDHVKIRFLSSLQTGWIAFDNVTVSLESELVEVEQRSQYSVAGQAIAQRQADVTFNDTFEAGNTDKWITSNQWSVNSENELSSEHSTNWIHMGAEVSQQGLTHYSWDMTMESSASGSSRGGFAIFGQTGSTGSTGSMDDSYFFYQDGGALRVYRYTNGTPTNLQGGSAPRVFGQTYSYRASYDPATGNIQVWRDGVKLIDVTDPNPIQTGDYIAVRARYGPIHFDNIRVMQETGLTYMVTDHLGSSRALVDTAGSVVDGSLTHFAPFGGYRGDAPSTNPELLENGYTGHKHNDSIGLIYMNARYYVPGIGRFASADTMIPEPAKSQSYNRYSYVYNNPMKFIDPTGHFSQDAIWQYMDTQCGGDFDCINTMMNEWTANEEWWQMLQSAKAGDILFGTFDPYGGIVNSPYGFYFTFMGDGNSRLDGIRFLEADTHGFTSVGSFWNNVTLSDLFSGQSTISSNSPNGHIIRHVWDGLVNGETYEPVFLKLSSMHIQASQAYQEIKRIQLRHQGLNPSASDVMNSIIKSVVRSLGTTTICGATGIALGPAYGPVCSVTMSGITATVDAYSTPPGDDYFYKLHVGPLVFKYGIADSEIGSDGKWSGESVYWGIE